MSLLSQASLVVVPSGYKEDVVYSVKPTDGSGDLTFTRASDGTRVNSQGLVERVPWNLLLQSNSFDTTWTNTRTTEASGYAGYNGTNDAWALIGTAVDSTHLIVQNITLSEQVVTFSVYAKAGAQDWCILRLDDGTPAYSYFDLSTGTKGTISASYIDSNITSVGGGWYRLSITRVATSGTNVAVIYPAEADNDNTYLGDGVTEDLYIQDAQINEGSTAKPYFPTTDRLNVPRLDYSNGCPSLLLEPQRTNLLPYSGNYESSWSAVNANLTTNDTTSPEGVVNASKVLTTSTSAAARLEIYPTLSDNTNYTLSSFVKKGNVNWCFIGLRTKGGITTNVFFDLVNGVTGTTAGSPIDYGVEDYGNDWYRVYLVQDSSSGGTTPRVQLGVANEDGVYPSDLNDYVYFYGAQLEAGSYPTSYIPTTSASVTRVADAASDVNLTPTGNKATLFIEVSGNDSFQNRFVAGFRNSTAWAYNLYYWGSVDNYKFGFNSWNGDSYGYANSNIFDGNKHKIAAVFDFTDFTLNTLFVDGVKKTISQVRGTTLQRTQSKVSLIAPSNDQNPIESVHQYVYFNQGLTDAECIALTTL